MHKKYVVEVLEFNVQTESILAKNHYMTCIKKIKLNVKHILRLSKVYFSQKNSHLG